MKRAFLIGFVTMLVAGLTPTGAHATDSTLPKTPKKFKLHAVGIAFQTVGMTTSKRIARPADQSIGLLTMDQVTLTADFQPPLIVPSSRLTWSGAATAEGPSVSVSFGSGGDRIANLKVQDQRGDKNTSAAMRVRFVSDITQAQFCSSSLAQATLCSEAVVDATLARSWSEEPTTVSRVGLTVADVDHGRTNAAKHAYWSLLLVRDFGIAFARDLTTAHERDGLPGAPHPGTVMDLDNNTGGRTIATGLTFSSFPLTNDIPGQDAVISAVNAGSLTILDDIGNPIAGLLQRSNQ